MMTELKDVEQEVSRFRLRLVAAATLRASRRCPCVGRLALGAMSAWALGVTEAYSAARSSASG